MSKLGKKSIPIPDKTSIKFEEGKIIFSGPNGNKVMNIDKNIFKADLTKDNSLEIKPIEKKVTINRIWGMTRSIANNHVLGVSKGFERILELTGVGYRVALKGDTLNLQLGFSHDINFKIPTEIKITVEKQTIIKIFGNDKEQVGKITSQIKSLKPTEPFKGKGIKERGEYILRKEGKKK